MRAPDGSHTGNHFWSRVLLGAGILVLGAAALLVDAGRGVFNSSAFASRATSSLDDPRVASFVADHLTAAVIAQRPNLIAVRPLLLGTVEGLVSSAPFRAAAYQGLR